METKKNILIINGSASTHSSNEKLINRLEDGLREEYALTIYRELKRLPHFDPELAVGDVPAQVSALREAVGRADAVVFCTPEYIFSIPSGLKNALEWCVATTLFTDKPVGIITAAAGGQKGHEELQLIMGKLGARLRDETNLLITGIKGKLDDLGEFRDADTKSVFGQFMDSLRDLFRS